MILQVTLWTTCAPGGGREFASPAPCGRPRARTRTLPTTSTDAPSPQGGPPRRVPGGAEPAGSGPEGERRTTSPGRPGELRMTTQRPAGPRRSDRRRPARGGCPPRSPPGAGTESHRQRGRRSPIRRGRGDDDQGGPLGRLLRGALPRPRARLPTGWSGLSTPNRRPNGRPDHPQGRFAGLYPQDLSPPCARRRGSCGAGWLRPVDAVCTRGGRTGTRGVPTAVRLGTAGPQPSRRSFPTRRSTRFRGPTMLSARYSWASAGRSAIAARYSV